jgi:YbgC/YbaW family acyl-CoA thioester hydrolase
MNELCTSIKVRFRDLDALGHMNYASYLTFLEESFNDLWKKIVLRAGKEFVPTALGCVTVRAEIDYRSQALCGETLDIYIWVTGVGRSSFTTAYRVLEPVSGRLVAEAKTVQVVTWRGAEKDCMPADIRSALVEMTT